MFLCFYFSNMSTLLLSILFSFSNSIMWRVSSSTFSRSRLLIWETLMPFSAISAADGTPGKCLFSFTKLST